MYVLLLLLIQGQKYRYITLVVEMRVKITLFQLTLVQLAKRLSFVSGVVLIAENVCLCDNTFFRLFREFYFELWTDLRHAFFRLRFFGWKIRMGCSGLKGMVLNKKARPLVILESRSWVGSFVFLFGVAISVWPCHYPKTCVYHFFCKKIRRSL